MKLGYKLFDVVNYTMLAILCIVTIYPVIYVFSVSVSDPMAVMQNKVTIMPIGFNLNAYKEIFKNNAIWMSYLNTIYYTIVGTIINVFMTVIGAYPLSRKKFWGRNYFMFFIAFTMFFSGGLIPTYLVVESLGLVNTRWSLLIPGAVSAFNLIVVKSFFETIPDSLEESVKIDGGNDITVLTKIFIPLSKPVIAVITLFYAVGHWNSYFNALIYLRDKSLYPLQLVLREILLMNQVNDMLGTVDIDLLKFTRAIQYATIVVSIVPMLVLYPFLQKYFVKGIVIGAIKE